MGIGHMRMKRSDITAENAKAAAEAGELEAVEFCRDKYRYWARYGLPEGKLEIYSGTCALCLRRERFPCPLKGWRMCRYLDCIENWRRVKEAAIFKDSLSFKRACRALANQLSRIAKELKASEKENIMSEKQVQGFINAPNIKEFHVGMALVLRPKIFTFRVVFVTHKGWAMIAHEDKDYTEWATPADICRCTLLMSSIWEGRMYGPCDESQLGASRVKVVCVSKDYVGYVGNDGEHRVLMPRGQFVTHWKPVPEKCEPDAAALAKLAADVIAKTEKLVAKSNFIHLTTEKEVARMTEHLVRDPYGNPTPLDVGACERFLKEE
jgi:hypothetical protein